MVAAAAAAADEYPKAERKRRGKFYGLRTFLLSGLLADFSGAFRDNVRAFLRECADAETLPTAGMPTWCTLLVDEKSGAVAPLFTVEESVRRSPRPFCDHCRFSGWSHHLVSKRRYHFIVPADDEWDRPGLQPNALQLHSHLLHGLLHCNGFGHLLSLNGRDGGSKLLSGSVLMDLFDRLCHALRAREVTVEDAARKRAVELRVLLGVAHGITWFERWGYRFRMGSFGVTREDIDRALRVLASLDLEALLAQSANAGRDQQLRAVVLAYRCLSRADPDRRPLATARDLLRYMLDIRRRSQPGSPEIQFKAQTAPQVAVETRFGKEVREKKRKRCRDFALVAAELVSRWPERRLRTTAHVVVDALLGRGRMTRQELRDAARLTIGDTGLLDFVLKSLGDCIVGSYIVRRTHNPNNRVLEFSLDVVDDNCFHGSTSPKVVEAVQIQPVVQWPSAGKVERDVVVVYRAMVAARPDAARVVLDGKHWGKAWALRDEEDDMLRFLIDWGDARGTPPELVVVAPHASVGDLRAEAERALRDTYCALERFRITALEGLSGEEWEPALLGGAESGAVLRARGDGQDEPDAPLRYEGGTEAWAVVCSCGARDDDGERMVACDVCDVWHHTRCVGIRDADPVPTLFLCARCGNSLLDRAGCNATPIKGF